MEAKTKLNNRLWQARRFAGLEQKQVARLLGHKTCDQISRYERGVRKPSFQTALKLELIYQIPLRRLFPDHYDRHRMEIAERLQYVKISFVLMENPPASDAHICTYTVSLAKSKLTAAEIDSARKHAINLHEKLSEAIQRHKPFSN